jgi:hypothetical protein
MRAYAAFAAVAVVVACWAFLSRGPSAWKLRRVLGDLVLGAILIGFAMLFLSQNGFIGHSDIQPYPY